MTSAKAELKARSPVSIIQQDKPASSGSTSSPGSITSTVSIIEGHPPASIFDDNDGPTVVDEVPKAAHNDMPAGPAPSLPVTQPAHSPPANKFSNTGEQFGSQLANAPASNSHDTAGQSIAGRQQHTCGATCAALLSVGGVALVALFGVLAVVGYKRRSTDQHYDMESSQKQAMHPDTPVIKKPPPRRKPKFYTIGTGGLRESVATEEEREEARKKAMNLLVGSNDDASGSGNTGK